MTESSGRSTGTGRQGSAPEAKAKAAPASTPSRAGTGRPPRLFIAGIGTETNTFTPFPTSYADFEDKLMERAGVDHLPPSNRTVVSQNWSAMARARGWEAIQGIHTVANPAGPVVASAYARLRGELLDQVRAAMPLDAVLLKLHGAMVAEDRDDCEGDLLACTRAVVGPDAVIGALLDLHCHMTPQMLEAADLLVLYKAYPHTDYKERGQELFTLVADTLEGRIAPVMAMAPCPVLGLFPTTGDGPMPRLVAAMTAAEGRDGILSLSLSHGFPWADVPIGGGAMLAIADGDRDAARRTAEDFAARFLAIAPAATMRFVPLDTALDVAQDPHDRPVLLADTADQIGGGGPGDSTYLLQALIERGIDNACLGPIWDALAVHYCFGAGVGARLTLRIGGKACALSGDPLDLEVSVRHLERDAVQDWIDNETIAVGDLAVVEAQGIEIVLTRERAPFYHPSLFTRHGIDIRGKRAICVKGLYRFYDIFAPICSERLLVATPGVCNPDWHALDYRRLPRPIWPLDPLDPPDAAARE